jgi:hypothetical protein
MTSVRPPSSRRVTARTALALAALAGAPDLALARPARSHPSSFARVFEENQSRVVSVELPSGSAAGFVVGAEGEVVFGAAARPPPEVRVEGAFASRRAALLGHDAAMGLAVARLEGGLPGPVTPVRVAAPVALPADTWVVVLRPDRRGRPEPFAGVVGRGASRGATLPVEVPGAVGAPIFSTDGALLGVSLAHGARRTRMLPVAALLPFLRAVVLGGAPRAE